MRKSPKGSQLIDSWQTYVNSSKVSKPGFATRLCSRVHIYIDTYTSYTHTHIHIYCKYSTRSYAASSSLTLMYSLEFLSFPGSVLNIHYALYGLCFFPLSQPLQSLRQMCIHTFSRCIILPAKYAMNTRCCHWKRHGGPAGSMVSFQRPYWDPSHWPCRFGNHF